MVVLRRHGRRLGVHPRVDFLNATVDFPKLRRDVAAEADAVCNRHCPSFVERVVEQAKRCFEAVPYSEGGLLDALQLHGHCPAPCMAIPELLASDENNCTRDIDEQSEVVEAVASWRADNPPSWRAPTTTSMHALHAFSTCAAECRTA